jgi:hypothetical protein
MEPTNNILRQASPSSGLAVGYITVGSLAAIWGAIWLYFLRNEMDVARWQYYVSTGVLLSGIALTIIGILVGRIGQEAQHADVPVGQITAATVQPTDAAPMQTVAAVPQASGAPVVMAQAPQPMAPVAAAPPRQG